jgi:TonB family protein
MPTDYPHPSFPRRRRRVREGAGLRDVSNSALVGISGLHQPARTAPIEAAPGPLFDLERAVTQAAPESSAPIDSRQRGRLPGLLLSLALHLLPLLFLVRWNGAPVEVPTPIPVRLVVEQPPPPPPEPATRPQPAAKPPFQPPRGRLASEEVGAPADEPNHPPTAQPPEAQPDPEPAPHAKAESEPELRQIASLVPTQQQPTLLDREALALPTPSVEPVPEKPAEPVALRQLARRSRPPQREAAIAGPAAARDEYLAHLVALVRPYLRLLPPELVNGRHGTTNIAIHVLGDGTIVRIAVAQSSGYPDIDARVIQIIAAVGRFPPLPPWIDQPSWEINFHLRFPFAEQAGSERR